MRHGNHGGMVTTKIRFDVQIGIRLMVHPHFRQCPFGIHGCISPSTRAPRIDQCRIGLHVRCHILHPLVVHSPHVLHNLRCMFGRISIPTTLGPRTNHGIVQGPIGFELRRKVGIRSTFPTHLREESFGPRTGIVVIGECPGMNDTDIRLDVRREHAMPIAPFVSLPQFLQEGLGPDTAIGGTQPTTCLHGNAIMDRIRSDPRKGWIPAESLEQMEYLEGPLRTTLLVDP
mmetsp:Transcript_16545/g.37985  ORF Transcript_16545/g.37985 Transcript_16545/m.37985 type:complete len:230 (+) Transcript_16545:508-1197(+)